jgi:type II secretory pathway pseudopilin PulG
LTLVEVMLVMAILLILASLALPIMSGPMANMRLRKSGDVIRTEWTRLRVQAMGDGKIYAFRYTLGSNRFRVETIDDPHFVETTEGTPLQNVDSGDRLGQTTSPDETAGTPSETQPSTPSDSASTETLPEGVYFADGEVAADPRSGYYVPAEAAEKTDDSGATWSAPILFYPDGTTSTARVLLKNDRPRCLEVRLRGFTGIAAVGPDLPPDDYLGQLDADALPIDAEFAMVSKGGRR